MKRIRQMKEEGVTILFVSHDSSSIKMLCEKAVLMNYGRILAIGTPKDVVNQYIALLSSAPTQTKAEEINSVISTEDFISNESTNNLPPTWEPISSY
jgi:lipopolysaccharide transport system ATP-binding protein